MSTTGLKLADIVQGHDEAGYLRELTQYYYRDKIAPGLQSAYLPDKKCYYVAVHRFTTAGIESRTVIAKATAETLEEAQVLCMKVWRSIVLQVEQERENAARNKG